MSLQSKEVRFSMATNAVEKETRAAVEELSRSVRTLVHTGRGVFDASANVMERELAMVIRISEALRDDVFSRELLERARKEPIPAHFREDLHRAADLVADLGAIAQVTTTRFLESFADTLVADSRTERPVRRRS
jgi:hypothetical protein